jgi:hypothetical protein
MNFVTVAVGILLVGAGFVTLVRKLHDRSIHEALAQLTYGRRDIASAVSAFAGLLVPIVSSIATGLAFVAVGVLTRW